jgi:hypothetical protein
MAVLDLAGEMSAIFEQEEMLAFFDLRLRLSESVEVEALGRLSRAKTNAGGRRYLSLFCLVDTPEETVRRGVEECFRSAPWSTWGERFRSVEEVVPMPPMHASENLYVVAVDIVLGDRDDIELLGLRLVETLGEVLPAEVGEIVSWTEKAPAETPKSRWQGIKEWLFRGR